MTAIDIPNKVIPVDVTAQEGIETWNYQDGTDDMWWTGGIQPRDYRWRIDIDVKLQRHSSHKTREPFLYNGYDVSVGDWIVSNTKGTALKVIKVESKTKNKATLIVEDVARYNTLRDPAAAGNGSVGVGQATIFTVSDEGSPKLDPVPPSGVSSSFYINLKSRFENFNPQYIFNLKETGHSFQFGDVVAVDHTTGSFVKSSSSHKTVIGTVSLLGPGPNRFYFDSIQQVIDDFDSLIGGVGNTLYVDESTPGGLTTNSNSGKAVYIKLRNNTKSFADSLNFNSSTTSGNKLEVNDVEITIGGAGSIDDAVSAFNGVSSTTKVTASKNIVPSELITSESLFYGEPGLFVDASNIPTATINGELVTFDITTVGQSQTGNQIAVEEDMAEAFNRDMDATGNSDLVADTPEKNKLRIRSLSGQSISITNGASDVNGIEFAGNSSGSGLPTSVTTSSDFVLHLEADDARAIELRNILGTPLEDYGIFSAENGVKAAALFVEQGLRSGSITVVPSIASRDSLSPLVGDMAYVIDSGNSDAEWALYLWDGSQWNLISDQDSAKTDANTLELIVTYNSPTATIPIGTLSNNSRVTLTTVTVTTPFDGTPTLSVGDSLDNSRLMDNTVHDLKSTGTYTIHSDHLYKTGNDVDINAYFAAGGATQGEAKLVLSYQ